MTVRMKITLKRNLRGRDVLALLIDGMNLIRRIHAALPKDEQSSDLAESLTRSVLGSIRRSLVTHRPTHVCAVIDGEGATWRHEIYPQYKANRSPMPEDLADDLESLIGAVESEGINTVRIRAFEADDVIASMTRTFARAGANVVVLSTDTSFCQLLSDGVTVYDHFANKPKDAAFVRERFSVTPPLLPTYLSLAGLPSSNIAGAKGVGPKGAAALVNEYGELNNIIAVADQITGRVGTLLRSQIADVELALQLVTLKTDVQVGRNLKQLRAGELR